VVGLAGPTQLPAQHNIKQTLKRTDFLNRIPNLDYSVQV